MNTFVFDVHDARHILGKAGHHDPCGMVIVEDKNLYMGDVYIRRDCPDAYILATPHDGWWMKGVGHEPDKDYRPPTDAEAHDFLSGVHLRESKFQGYLESK